MRVDDSPSADSTGSLPHRVDPARHRRRNDEHDQALEPRVAPATLLEVSLIAATLADPETAGFIDPPSRAEPWRPPHSSLPLRDRSV